MEQSAPRAQPCSQEHRLWQQSRVRSDAQAKLPVGLYGANHRRLSPQPRPSRNGRKNPRFGLRLFSSSRCAAQGRMINSVVRTPLHYVACLRIVISKLRTIDLYIAQTIAA